MYKNEAYWEQTIDTESHVFSEIEALTTKAEPLTTLAMFEKNVKFLVTQNSVRC